MRNPIWLHLGTALLLPVLATGCDQLKLGQKVQESTQLPSPEALQRIGYMSSAASGPGGRKVYNRFEEAKTCGDFELALRWNRPPDIEGGPYHKKMVYLTQGIPADLPKNSEVFISGTTAAFGTLPSGAAGWSLKMKDGSTAQAIETASYWEKQEQAAQAGGKIVAVVDPERPGRAFCAQGVYEGVMGKAPGQDGSVPLVAVLFAMDRKK
jgi:hypothetical protein